MLDRYTLMVLSTKVKGKMERKQYCPVKDHKAPFSLVIRQMLDGNYFTIKQKFGMIYDCDVILTNIAERNL